MNFTVDTSLLRSDEEARELLRITSDDNSFRVVDTRIPYPGSDESSDLVCRHLQIQTGVDILTQQPVFEDIKVLDLEDAMKAILEYCVRLPPDSSCQI